MLLKKGTHHNVQKFRNCYFLHKMLQLLLQNRFFSNRAVILNPYMHETCKKSWAKFGGNVWPTLRHEVSKFGKFFPHRPI
jgi:hypothetical protein